MIRWPRDFRRALRLGLYWLLGAPETYEELQAALPDAHMEPVGDRHELVIYTGWDYDESGALVPMLEIDATVTVTEDQARLGGCCTCPDGCGGDQPADGQPACDTGCTWCYHGCPARGRCTCQDEPAVI